MEETARHLRLLVEVVAAVTATLDLEEVLDRVAISVAGALAADACFVYEHDAAGDALVLASTVGASAAPGAPPRLRVGEGITGTAAARREPLWIERDAHLDPRFQRLEGLDEDAYSSILAVPVLARDELVGALNVRTLAPRAYRDDEVALLVTIAAQVGQAIENARLWGRSQRRIAELEALAGIAQAALSAGPLDEQLAEVVRAAADASHADTCALVLVPAHGGEPTLAARAGDSGPSDAELIEAAARAPISEPGLLAVPVAGRTGEVGALVCARLDLREFTRGERVLLRTVAAQAAVTVSSARGAMRGLLAQEIHHRVKNNLQTVASLLRLAASAEGDPRRALRDSVGRVLAIAEVHDLLTASRDDDVDAADLVRRLTAMLCQTGGGTADARALAPMALAPVRATALALVYCELVANSIEHGGGRAVVQLRRDGAFGELVVADEGPGGEALVPGQGLTIARALAESDLGGSLALVDARPGLRATLRFPLGGDGAARP